MSASLRGSKRIICFNGPPGSGKDTATNWLWRKRTDVSRLKLIQPATDALIAMFNLFLEEVKEWDSSLEEKLMPRAKLLGKSWRQAKIDYSESYMKPVFGNDVFGRLAIARMRVMRSIICISDSGFATELAPIAKLYGEENMLIVQLHREHCSFEHDSRGYVLLPKVKMIKVRNIGTLTDFCKQVSMLVEAWLGEGGVDD